VVALPHLRCRGTTDDPLLLRLRLINLTSLVKDLYTLACPLHCRTTSSKENRMERARHDLTNTKTSVPIRSRYWYSRRLEQRPSNRVSFGQHAQVLVIPMHRFRCNYCRYGRFTLVYWQQVLTNYNRSVAGKVQDDPGILTSLHSRHGLARRYRHTCSHQIRCILRWTHC
jgi:hypothetical protein